MALPTIKTTYTVDVETKHTLDRLAGQWEVSRSEALRRAIRQAAGSAGVSDRLAALDALQRQTRLSASKARQWEAEVRAERRAAAPTKRRHP